MARRIARGEIWTYELRGPDKVRPVVVLARDEAIPYLNAVMVVPVTSTIRGLPSEVVLDARSGLKHVSAAKLDAVQTVDKTRLRRFIGTVPAPLMREICHALEFAAGCSDRLLQ